MSGSTLDHNASEPDGYDIARAVASARVVIFCSDITDIRYMTERLHSSGIPHTVVRMGMADRRMRAQYDALRKATGWQTLPQVFVDGRFIGGYDEFFAYTAGHPDTSIERRIPLPALLLGASGLIPFLAATAAAWFAPADWQQPTLRALALYAALILTFVGAVHWGLALGKRIAVGSNRMRWRLMGFSVLPALVAWLGLLWGPLPALLLMVAAFLAVFVADILVVREHLAPAWYLPLRSALTAVVTTCLMLSFLSLPLRQEATTMVPTAATHCQGCAFALRVQDAVDRLA